MNTEPISVRQYSILSGYDSRRVTKAILHGWMSPPPKRVRHRKQIRWLIAPNAVITVPEQPPPETITLSQWAKRNGISRQRAHDLSLAGRISPKPKVKRAGRLRAEYHVLPDAIVLPGKANGRPRKNRD